MRLRKIEYAGRFLEAHQDLVLPFPEKHLGNWKNIFQNDFPIYIEVGCGKGQFIMDLAQKYPQINFIGIEKYDSVVIRGLEKLLVNPLPNVRFIQKDALRLTDFFANGEVDRLYLNFSDPWPKVRQAKRRLTHPAFLKKYRQILKNESKICLKTDNFGLFEYSMMTLNQDSAFAIDQISLDYHETPDNIPTEFELKFVSQGKKIFYIQSILYKEKHS